MLPIRDIVSTPRAVFDNHDQHRHLPPANGSCIDAQPPVKPTKLSQTLFPVSNPENNRSWVGENHKTLQALFRCMELSNCGPNQKKGYILLSLTYLILKFTLISRYFGFDSFSTRTHGIDWWRKYMVSRILRCFQCSFLSSVCLLGQGEIYGTDI